jgi:nitrite reductase/ring-hydroxylating ferredoxin subunit
MREETRMARRRALLIVAAVGLAAVAVAVVVSVMAGDDRLSLRTVPSGVSARRVGRVDVFLVRDGRQVIAFVNSSQHMPGEKIWWCRKEEVFAAPTHGETFDAQGRRIGGPASRDLDRLAVSVGPDGKMSIDPSKVVAGAVTPAAYPRPQKIPDLAAEWPAGFCSSHLAA